MTRKSPVPAGRSTGTRRAARSRRACSCWSSASSGTWGSARPTSSPVYPPRAALGRTWTVALKGQLAVLGDLLEVELEVVVGTTPASLTASEYQPPSALSISCTTSRPTRWTMTSAAPSRPEAGHAHLAAELAHGPLHLTPDLVPGTATSSRTRFSSRG